MILLKVKRRRNQEELDQLYLEYDEASGLIKKTKMVTESEALVSALS